MYIFRLSWGHSLFQTAIAYQESNGIDIIVAIVLNDINPLAKRRMSLVLQLKNDAAKLLLSIMESRQDSDMAERIMQNIQPSYLVNAIRQAYNTGQLLSLSLSAYNTGLLLSLSQYWPVTFTFTTQITYRYS